MIRGLALLVLAANLTACGGSPPTTITPIDAEQAVQRRVCRLAHGAVSLSFPVPEGHALAVSPEACMLMDEQAAHTFLISASALPQDDEGPEALLQENPDGVLRWALRSGLFGDARSLDEGRVRVAGRRLRWYRIEGTPQGLGPSEVTLARLRRGGYNVVLMAVHPRGDEAERLRALRTLRAIENP